MASKQWAGSDFQDPPRSDGGVALCAACSPGGTCRLGLTTEVLGADGVARFDIVCPPEHEGGPGVAHGGWSAAVLDEVLGHIPLLHGTLSVTKKLEVEYLRPVPIGRPLVASGWIERKDPGSWRIAGELALAATLAPLARAHGTFVLRDRSHFARYEAWLAEEDANSAER